MVQDPTQFDVLVMPNLYGDILRSAIYSLCVCVCVCERVGMFNVLTWLSSQRPVCRADRRTWCYSQREHRSKWSRHI